MKVYNRCVCLMFLGVAILSRSFPASAGPAYRAGWGGSINYNINRWHYWEDNPVGTSNATLLPEIGVFTGPICVTNHATGYAYGLKGFWNSGWYSEWGKSTCWGGYRTWRFTGQMYFDGSTYQFGEKISQYILFRVDGEKVFQNDNADDFNSKTITPSAGWHDIDLRCGNEDGGNNGSTPPGAIDNGADGYLLGFGYAKTATAPTGMSSLHYPYDSGTGAFLRSVAPEDFFTVDSFSIAGNTYIVTITAAALPESATACLYLGDGNAVAENGSEATWTVAGNNVSLAPGQTTTVSATWTGAGTPYFSVKVSGMMDSLDLGYVGGGDSTTPVAGGPRLAFWQWSDPAMATVVPNVAATFAGVTGGTEADFTVTLGYDIEIPGVTPDIAVTAYYGATDAGTVAGDWSASQSFGGKAVGIHDLALTGLTAGASYYVRFAVQTPGSDLVWSGPMFVSLAGVYLSGLDDAIYENYPLTHSFTVNRPTDAVDDPLTVHLAYTGDTNRVTTLPASVTLPVGTASASVSFSAVDNSLADGGGSFTVAIVPDSLYVVGSPSSLSATITDDETSGDTDTWTGGAGDGLWETGGNWSLGRPPTVLDTAVFQYQGFGATRSVSISSAAVAAKIRVASGDALAFTGSGSLSLGGIDRNGIGWPFGALDISVPVTVFAGEGGTNVWDVGQTALNLNASLSKAGPVCIIKKLGTGKLTINVSTADYTDGWHIAEGETESKVANGIGGMITIGGENATARLTQNGQFFVKDGSKITVLDKGTFYSNQAVRLDEINVYEGGRAQTCYCEVIRYQLHGGTIEKSGSWAGEARVRNNSNSVRSFASDVTAYFNQNLALSNWGNAEFNVEDGAAPVDLVFGSFYQNYENAASYISMLRKTGTGTLKVTQDGGGNNIINRDVEVSAGTWLADAPGSGTGHRKTYVRAGATLGGVGRVLGSQIPNTVCVEVAGNSGAKGVVAPGTIDETTGDHVYGTLTIGAEDCANGISFAADTRLRITFGERGDVDQLKVYGPINVNARWTALELVSPNPAKVRGGEYVVATATGGIATPFETVLLPDVGTQWTVKYGADSITVRVPGTETVLLLR